jgi:hypothetical protein
MKVGFALLLFSVGANAFQDSDIDGVSDTLDLCPNTPFEALVNSKGCSTQQEGSLVQTKADNYIGALTLKIGDTMLSDESYDDENYLNLYANYRYRKWDVSLSNSRATTSSSYTEDNSNSDDNIYLSTGYTFTLPKSTLKFSVGTKIVDDDASHADSVPREKGYSRGNNNQSSSLSTTNESALEARDDDYFASVNYNYSLTNKQNLFLYYGYTSSGDSQSTDYEDYSSFSIGTGHSFGNSLYGALSYTYTGSIYPDVDAEQGITLFGSYNFNKNIFATASYTYALEDYSYDDTLSFGLGFYFQ